MAPSFIRRILPTILTFFTKIDRYFPVPKKDFEWSHKSWTHNFFRVYEIVFGCRTGIRLEARTNAVTLEDGSLEIVREFYTAEAGIAYAETCLRSFFKVPKFAPFRIYVPMLATPMGNIHTSPYLFAIAFDAVTPGASNSASSYTLAHTCTGSNLNLTCGGEFVGATSVTPSATYATVSMTKVVSSDPYGDNTRNVSLFDLASPATGANNLVISTSPNCKITIGIMSFSGTNTASPVGASGSAVGSSSTLSKAITTDTANSIIVDCFMSNNYTLTYNATGTNQTKKYQQAMATPDHCVAGSYMTTTTAGSYTPAWSWTSATTNGMAVMEVHAAVAAGPANLKSYNTNLKANIKSVDTNLIANIKSLDTNT